MTSDLRIKVRYPNERVAYFPFSGAACLVGRAPDSDVQIRTAEVSWRHLRLQRRGDEILAEDLGSSGGTLVGDRPLLRGVVRPIDRGESIFIGAFELTVEAANAPTEVAARSEVVVPGGQDGRLSQAEIEDGGAAFGGWLSSLEGRDGVEIAVERTRVTVRNSPTGADDFDPSDLPTTRVEAVTATAGPLDETIRVPRPNLEQGSEETAQVPAPTPLDATLPVARPVAAGEEVLRVPIPRSITGQVENDRSLSGGQQQDAVEPAGQDRDSAKPRGGGVPTWQMMARPERDPSDLETDSRSRPDSSPRSSMRDYQDRIQHQSMVESTPQQREQAFSQLPWGAVLKTAGAVALILGLAALVFVLLQLFA